MMSQVACRIYEDLDALEVDVAEVPLKNNVAISLEDNFIALDPSRCRTEQTRCTVLAHEAGHFISGAFYPAHCDYAARQQAEYQAFVASVRRYIPAEEIQTALQGGYTETWQLADYFGLEEEYIKKALDYWRGAEGFIKQT